MGGINMSKYYSFNDFMNEVIYEADSICRRKYDVGLENLFDASHVTFTAVMKLIDKGGWLVFLAVVALLALGSLGILLGITTFLTTPVGLTVALILGGGAATTLYEMYRDRLLPQAVRDVGEKYKKRWENADGNHSIIDKLKDEAANELYNKAINSGTEMALRILRSGK